MHCLNRWVIIGAIAVAFILFFCWGSLLTFLGYRDRVDVKSPANLVIISAPTPTPVLLTPTPDLTATQSALSYNGISVGSFVQITGTEGKGLRLRAGAGLSSPLLFVGMEAEVFEVRDGPVESDNYVWWYLVAPYDQTRSGWAASNYLTLVSPAE
ncbi:MAG: SH3 domain-containing protein [Anaerolineales bacterium]|jgi:hypothetical protein